MKPDINLVQEVSRLSGMVQQLQNRLAKFENSDRYIFLKDIELQDGNKIILGGTQGTKIGVATSKIGFFGTAPVVKQTNPGSANSQGGSYVQADVQSIATSVNAVITRGRALGLWA